MRAKQFTRCCGGADQTTDSSEVLEDSPRRKRSFLFLTREKGLRSRWQSRQRDRAERRRRSSEFMGALHSSQRGGPTRPLWSCAIEIPPSRTQTGEQMKQQSVWLSSVAFKPLYWKRFCSGHTLGTSSFCGGGGPRGPSALHPMGAHSRRSSEWGPQANAQNEVPAADANGAPALGRLQAV